MPFCVPVYKRCVEAFRPEMLVSGAVLDKLQIENAVEVCKLKESTARGDFLLLYVIETEQIAVY